MTKTNQQEGEGVSSLIYQLRFSSGQVYIGRTRRPQARLERHLKDMRYGYHTKRVQKAYDLFGEPVFEIIHRVTDDEYDVEVEANCIAGAGARSLNFAHGCAYEQIFTDKDKFTIKRRFVPEPNHPLT